jgi:hypothetical protein
MVTQTTEYKGYQIHVTADQVHSSPEWGFWFRVDPEPEVMSSLHPRVIDKLRTRKPWKTADEALSAAFAEAMAVIDVQIFKDSEPTFPLKGDA